MPSNYKGNPNSVSSIDAIISCPVDADPPNAGSVNTPLQQLADRMAKLIALMASYAFANWKLFTTGVPADSFIGICAGPGTNGTRMWVAVGGTTGAALISTSDDGITWTARAPGSGSYTLNAVAFNGASLFVAVGSGGNIRTSADGITWATRVSATTSGGQAVDWKDVCWSSALGLWIAVGWNAGANVGVVATSADGITWTRRYEVAGAWLVAVAANGSTLVAIATTGTSVYRSTNGTAWAPVVVGDAAIAGGEFVKIGSAGGLFFFMGNNGVTSKVWTSSDGLTWTARYTQTFTPGFANAPVAVFGAGVYAIKASGHGWLLSQDGVQWMLFRNSNVLNGTASPDNPSGGTFGHGRCIIGGSSGNLFTSLALVP